MDSTTLAPPAVTKAPFPAAAVEACLRAELIEAVKIDASIRGIPLPSSPAQVARAAIEIDSVVVVEILCAIDPIVGIELPDSVVRTGGYASVESALDHLLPRIERVWTKQKGAKA
jgi:hypothetical protein